MNIRLVRLSEEYQEQLFEMMDEWCTTGEKIVPYAIQKNDYHDFEYYLNNLEIIEEVDGKVPDTTLFCLDEDRNIFVGAVNIRHYLTEEMLVNAGHIGDGIRPSERRKGYATAMIGLALEEAKKLGISRVLMCCDKENIASAKSIINNGGILENEVVVNGVTEQRYWIKNYMYTKKDLMGDLKNMGLKPTDTIMVHSSMKAIGPVEGRADTVIDAFMEYFKEGLFLMPTHTWAQMSEEYSLFDPKEEPACVGILPNIFRRREGVVRSLHPTHSIAAYGPRAKTYIEGEDEITTPCQPGGCWSRLLEEEAKILMLGCTHTRNTFIHAVEELLDVPERLTKEPVNFQIKMPDGNIKEVFVHRHYNRIKVHISEEYDKLLQAYYDCGAAKKVKFGDADCILCDARKIYEVTEKVLSHEINCLIDREEIPREWWMKC